jgi:hypothetical protein
VRAEYIRTGAIAMTDKLIIDSGRSRKMTDGEILQENLQKELEKERQKKAGGDDSGTKTRIVSKTSMIEPDEIVWGNDRAFMDKIDEVQRADLRLFVRIRHMQKVTCSTAYEDITKEPYELDKPIELMIVDISVGGIGVICEHEIDVGRIFGIPVTLDAIPYVIKCEAVYCIPLDDKFRAGFKIVHKEKRFMRHLKIFIARISLTSTYASGE